jgi:hypothetical protein
MSTTPSPSEGESPRDNQSETVSAPHPDSAPPRRTRRAGISAGLLILLLLVLGSVLLVLALLVAL